MKRIAIFIILLLAVFTFINAYSVERESEAVETAQVSALGNI